MESLETKLTRLPPERQREVEDFVDFLLQRQGEKPPASSSTASLPPVPVVPVPVAPPPPLPFREPAAGQSSAAPDELIRQSDKLHSPVEEPTTLPVHETAPGKEDPVTAEYMDYGRFEVKGKSSAPSPADEAVRRVKIRLSGKRKTGPADNLLDWVD